MNISVCIDAVMKNLSVGNALDKLKSLGCGAFEFWAWWTKDLNEMCEAIGRTGLIPAAMCTKFVSLVEPENRNEYKEGLEESIEAAKKLGVKTLISQTGDDTGKSRAFQHESLAQGLRECAPILEKNGVTLVVEPLNTYIDHKGYYLDSSTEAFTLIDEVGSNNVKILYDIYHMQIMEGNLINTITLNIDKIGHFHAAGLPGRHEPYIGEINYDSVFDAIDRTSYKGYTGLEYFPIQEDCQGILKYLSKQ